MLNHVEKLVAHGFAVHLLKKKSKAPAAGKDWSELPVASFEKLKRDYRDGMNVGLRTGKWSKVHGYYLHVIDADIRDKDKTAEAFDALSDFFPDYMEYPEVQSGSMGPSRHFYLLTDKPFASRKFAHSEEFDMVFDEKLDRDVKKWKWELEFFGTGKQVAIPPSIHPTTGKPYRWISEFDFADVILGDAPCIVSSDLIKEVVFNGNESDTAVDPNDERIKPIGIDFERAEEIIAKLPQDEWLEDRDGWLRLGMALHHEFAGSKEAFELWNKYSRLSKKFDLKNSKGRWRSFRFKAKPFRMASLVSVVRDIELEEEFMNLAEDGDDMDELPKKKRTRADDLLGDIEVPEKEYPDLGKDEDGEEIAAGTKRLQKIKKAEVEEKLGKKVPPKVARLNKIHAVASVKGKTVVITEYDNGEVAFGSLTDLHNWYEHDRVPTEKSSEPVSKAWMRHKQKRMYSQGVVFEPNNQTPNAYNLWRGWSVQPDPEPNPERRCKLFLQHLKKIICKGDEIAYRYLLGWLAHMVQKPEDKPGVAVVVRGKKGAGKDTVAEYFSEILKHHYMMINQREHLVGKFNAHQERLMFMHVEEGYWAGSKQDEGPLKSIITSPTVTIERKGVDAFKVNSVLRIYMTSNEDWVVPASGQDERRYFVTEADDAWSRSGRFGKDPKARKAYFDALRHEMKNGGRPALLAYLMDYDISEDSDFDIYDPPATAALDQQKIAGLTGVDRWWGDQLMIGEPEFDIFDFKLNDPVNWYRESFATQSDIIFDAYQDWFRRQRYHGNPLSRVQFFVQLSKITDMVKIQQRTSEGRKVICRIENLSKCRTAFDNHLGTEIEWKKYDVDVGPDIDDDDDI